MKLLFKNGKENISTKLSEQQVLQILKSNDLQKNIARNFGISQSTVSCIKIGTSWNHLTRKSYNRKRKFQTNE